MNMVGLIFANIYDSSLGELTNKRTMASLPYGGRYRQIDFALSNMSNAGIRHIGIPNLPSAVSNTASAALSNASIKYVMELADKGWKKACQEDKCLEYGLDFVKGHLTFKTTAEALGMELTSKEWCYENL